MKTKNAWKERIPRKLKSWLFPHRTAPMRRRFYREKYTRLAQAAGFPDIYSYMRTR
jgi:hypothetical protein